MRSDVMRNVAFIRVPLKVDEIFCSLQVTCNQLLILNK